MFSSISKYVASLNFMQYNHMLQNNLCNFQIASSIYVIRVDIQSICWAMARAISLSVIGEQGLFDFLSVSKNLKVIPVPVLFFDHFPNKPWFYVSAVKVFWKHYGKRKICS